MCDKGGKTKANRKGFKKGDRNTVVNRIEEDSKCK